MDFVSLLAVEGNCLAVSSITFENTGRMETFSMPGESDLVESFMFGHVYLILSSGTNDLRR